MIRNIRLVVLVVLMVGWFGKGCAAQITKVFHHEGQCDNKLVFYFDGNPKLTRVVRPGFQEYRLLNTSLGKLAEDQLKIALKRQSGCTVTAQADGDDYLIRIVYSPKKIGKISAAKFKAVSSFDGLSIKISRLGFKAQHDCDLKVSNSKLIVLDFGHGGKDAGAQANGVTEKQVVQEIGLRLQRELQQAGYTVKLTRQDDSFIALDQRTALANLDTGANLFISLHANFAANHNVSGLETYYLHSSQLQMVELDQVGHQKLDQHSQKLAELIHKSILTQVSPAPLDRRVRQTVSQVLLGAEMPAVLIELGYLSNPQEAQRLSTAHYQEQLAHAIALGVQAYLA